MQYFSNTFDVNLCCDSLPVNAPSICKHRPVATFSPKFLPQSLLAKWISKRFVVNNSLLLEIFVFSKFSNLSHLMEIKMSNCN